MNPIIFKRILLTLMLMLSIGSAGASFTVKVGENSTLTFEVNEDDTTTVTLIKCECGAWYGRKFYWEEVTVIPDEVTVNGVAKTVTQINSKQSTNASNIK